MLSCFGDKGGAIWYGNGMKGANVLVVDDDGDIRALVRRLLEAAGCTVSEAATGREAVRTFHTLRPDLVVLDVTMPELDGWQTLERIRDLSDVPVLMLSARATELEKVRGLRAGADDYVTKPFGRQELLARVGALLRRGAGRGAAVRPPYEDSRLRFDFEHRRVVVGKEEVSLTPLEYRLLATFVEHADQVLSHDQLLVNAWGDEGVSREQVKIYVGYLRRKLGAPDAIESVRGFGYRYRAARA